MTTDGHRLGQVAAARAGDSSLSASSSIASATIVFSTLLGNASDWLDPSARNSNLLPVKANGEVRLRSPPCIGSGGSTGVPSPRNEPGVCGSPSPDAIASKTFSSSAPRKIEMIAGGASLAPRRWSWPIVGHRGPQQPLVLVHGLDHGRAEEQEVDVVRGRVAGLEQVDAGVRAHRPVVVLARAVHARERLLVQQADEPVLARDARA